MSDSPWAGLALPETPKRRQPKLKLQAMSPEDKPRFRLSPELVDGEHYAIVDSLEHVIEAIRLWAEEGISGAEPFSVEVIYMTDAEVEALEEV